MLLGGSGATPRTRPRADAVAGAAELSLHPPLRIASATAPGHPVLLANRLAARPSRSPLPASLPFESARGDLLIGLTPNRTVDTPLRTGPPPAKYCQGMDRNVLGETLEPCGSEPLTGFYRDGCCRTGPEDIGSHTICAS